MQYLDPGNARMGLSSIYTGSTYITHHHSYASIPNSSSITPGTGTAAASSLPNHFREFRPEAVNSQLNRNVPLRLDRGSSTSQVPTEGITCKMNSMPPHTSNVNREVGLLAERFSSDTVPRVRSSPCLTSTDQELNLLGNANASEITSSYPSQQDNNGFRVNQSIISQQEGASNANAVQLRKSQQLLLMYHHAIVHRGFPMFANLKKTIEHVLQCNGVNCTRNCATAQRIIRHYKSCHDLKCKLCGPVREIISKRGSTGTNRIDNNGESTKMHDLPSPDEPGPKRVKTDQCDVMEEPKVKSVKDIYSCVKDKSEEQVKDSNNPVNKILENNGMEVEWAQNLDTCGNNETVVKEATKQRVRGASLLDTFTPEEISVHLKSLRLCENKTKERNEQQQQPLDQVEDQNKCTLCGMEELLFAPPPRYCGKCAVLIVSHGVYYCTTGETTRNEEEGNNPSPSSFVPISLCSRCYNVSGETVKLPSRDVQKACFEKRSNYAETDADSEWWVQCSKCEAWQHQICALFNGRRKEANAEYTCVNCFLKEIENGEFESLDQIKILGACDLPRTMLSDYIEKRLFTQLEIEREERATNLGKKVEEVPGVEDLCVRVVSSVDRMAYVQPNFKEFLKGENYPSEFPYKSKAIVLFQKIEGVDVCLFALYVQEYGSRCPFPNQRHTYISYIDSVKYFRPEIKSSSGEALRTFVYHGILIAYLDYCKKRGFASCSLWACPPTKHDDYILYCHPTSQKMPKAEKLRSWYQAMITRAVKEKVVVERTNLYDYYLIPTNDWKTSISAAHLPYCENDFWPGEAEFILSNNNKEKSRSHNKETEPKGRAIRAAKRGLMDGKPDDIMLLHKLGERMRSMKEDFLLIYLQPTCKHCRRAIVSGTKWVCSCCKNFLLCNQCYSEEEELPPKDRHPTGSKFKHEFQKVKEPPLPATDDPDPRKECEFFDSRTDLLKLCQNKLYQFDTLRRAKHSTMMILHHLHTPSCSTCHTELSSDEISWRCPTCPGYYMCASCYKRGVWEFAHDHDLVRLSEMVTNTGTDAPIGKAKGNTKNTFKQLALETLVHASRCTVPRCEQRLCRKMKLLFRHGVRCKIRQGGGCLICNKVWYLMQLHCRSCQNPDCKISRCKEIKDHISKLRDSGS